MINIIRLLKKIGLLIVLFPLKLFPIKENRIILMNSLANKYSDNPKYVAEYLSKNYANKFELIYPVQNVEQYHYLLEKNIIPVRVNSLNYYFLAMTSKVFVTNSGGFSYLPLKKTQIVINTWHGGGAYKKIGIDNVKNSKFFTWELQLTANKTNHFLSTNRLFSESLSKALLINQNIFWEIGMPRSDMLINSDNQLRNQIREKLGIKEGQKLVLYAPTYRKPQDNILHESIAIDYNIDVERVKKALTSRFGGDWKFGLRLHPMIKEKEQYHHSDVLNLSEYEDMQELILAADVMINDFSSSLWDCVVSNKPCFVYANDLNHYIQNTEVYCDISNWPFPKATTNDILVDNILNFDSDNYIDECKRHYDELGGCETGEATKIVCDKIYEMCY